jgi:hypothetical protein
MRLNGLNYIIPGVNQQKESHLLDTINVNDNFGTDDCHTQRDIDIGRYPIYTLVTQY